MRNQRNENPNRNTRPVYMPNVGASGGLSVKEGILTEDLAPSTNSGQTETTATFLEYTGTGASWASTGDTYTATNRNDGVSAASGSHIVAFKINGEWRPFVFCEARNEFWSFDMIGGETSGSFDVTFSVGGVEDTITLKYDDTAAEVKTAFETHSQIATNDVSTSGGPFPSSTIIVEFVNNLAATEIGLPVLDRTNLVPFAGSGVQFSRYPGSPN